MTPQPVTVEVCSGPNDGESIRAESGTFTIGSRGAADLPLAGEPGLPPLATVTATAEGATATISADTDFEYAGKSTRSIECVTLPAMIKLGGVDLCLSAADGVPVPNAQVAGDAGLTDATAVGPICSDCGRVNPPGAARCDRCRRWLD